MMQIDSETRDGVALVTLAGDAMGGPDGSALLDRLHELRGDGSANVVVDLGGVRHMNSSGLGMLIGALTSARNAGGDLRLAAINSRIQTLLSVTQLLDVFQTFDTADQAVASFE